MVSGRLCDGYLLVPPPFQEKYGKFIKTACYDGYGHFGSYQVNELIAEWNKSFIPEVIGLIKEGRWYDAAEKDIPILERYLAESSALDEQEREWVGILLSVYDENNSRLPNPIKITSKPMEYDEVGYSPSDPNQGWEEDEEEYEMLLDHFPDYDYDPEDDDRIIVNGKSYPVEMNLSPEIPDYRCMRVMIDGKYYYYG